MERSIQRVDGQDRLVGHEVDASPATKSLRVGQDQRHRNVKKSLKNRADQGLGHSIKNPVDAQDLALSKPSLLDGLVHRPSKESGVVHDRIRLTKGPPDAPGLALLTRRLQGVLALSTGSLDVQGQGPPTESLQNQDDVVTVCRLIRANADRPAKNRPIRETKRDVESDLVHKVFCLFPEFNVQFSFFIFLQVRTKCIVIMAS